ncbi:MAG: septum formation initiator family protein [Rhodospirillales bacterium]|nr:septum formation initiator family protein [Rhodospirillales bacterium]
MSYLMRVHARVRQVIGPVLGSALIIYTAYHAVQGDRGLIAYWQLTKQLEQAGLVRDVLAARRADHANRARLLNPKSIDRDMLDERTRYMLGYSHPDDIIIIVGKSAGG